MRQRGGTRDVAGVGVQPVGEKREQRRLAGAVAADQADLFAGLDGEAGAIENELDAATQRDLGENEHGVIFAVPTIRCPPRWG